MKRFILGAISIALPFISGCADDLVGASLETASPSLADARELNSMLTGAAEVPGPGDADGTGSAIVRTDPGANEVCFQLTVQNIAPASAAHIHEGAVGVAGPVVVTLTPPTNGASHGCVGGVDVDLVKDIRKNPANYYVNVHNADFPGGAVRGQLSR